MYRSQGWSPGTCEYKQLSQNESDDPNDKPHPIHYAWPRDSLDVWLSLYE